MELPTLNKEEYGRLCRANSIFRECFSLIGKMLGANYRTYRENYAEKESAPADDIQDRKRMQYDRETLHIYDMFNQQYEKAMRLYEEYTDRIAGSYYMVGGENGIRQHDLVRKDAANLLKTYMHMENSFENPNDYWIYERGLINLESESKKIFRKETIDKIDIKL